MESRSKFTSVVYAVAIILIGLLIIYLVQLDIVSSEFLPWVMFILIIVLIAGGAIYNAWSNKKRRETIEQAAPEMGLTYQSEDKAFSKQLTDNTAYKLFKQGRNRKAYNILRGQHRNADITIFDYKYTVGGGRSSRTYMQTAALLRLEKSNLTQFVLKPRGFLNKVARKLGQTGIEFENRLGFNDRYQVTGSDEAAIRHLFSDPVLTYFENQEKWSVEANTNELLIYRANAMVAPQNLRQFLDDVTQLGDMFSRPSIDMDLYDFGIKK